jgi:hypothetical protein
MGLAIYVACVPSFCRKARQRGAGGTRPPPPCRHRLGTAAQVAHLACLPGLAQRTVAIVCAQTALRCLRREGARNEYAVAIAWCGRERCCGGGRYSHAQIVLHDAPISPAAACTYVTLRCGTIGHRTSAGAISIAAGNVSCGVPAVLRNIRAVRASRPNAAAGALVTKFAATARFARARFPRARHPPLVTASARVLRKIGAARAVRSYPCALRMHAKADTTSHGRAPTRACDDLPHWQNTIRSKDGQCQILLRGAAFEAISGAGHRILLATGAGHRLMWQETRNMPSFRWRHFAHENILRRTYFSGC